MKINQKIYIAGHNGMVGSAIARYLHSLGCKNIITRTRQELDLTNAEKVAEFLQAERPDQVYVAAAKVGGIHANDMFPAEFIYENLAIELNLIHQSYKAGIKKLLFLGSSCLYPKLATQPIEEQALLSGFLEPTNEPYAIAKIAGIKMCESYNRQYGESDRVDYRCVMPTNLYGPGDNFHENNSHVIPGLLRRFHLAKVQNNSEVLIWGDGSPLREFLYVDDLAEACVFLMRLKKDIFWNAVKPMVSHINVGFGGDISIKDLAYLIAEIVGYRGEIKFDTTKPTGTPRKLLNSSVIRNLGWSPKVDLEAGLRNTYQFFVGSAG
jgi:GDP-L-fucose synthase